MKPVRTEETVVLACNCVRSGTQVDLCKQGLALREKRDALLNEYLAANKELLKHVMKIWEREEDENTKNTFWRQNADITNTEIVDIEFFCEPGVDCSHCKGACEFRGKTFWEIHNEHKNGVIRKLEILL